MFYLHQRNFCSSVNGLRISKSNSRKLLEHIGVPWQKGIHFSQSSHIFIYINIIFFFFLSLWEKHWLKEKCWIDWQGARTLGSARQAPLDSFVSWIFFFFFCFCAPQITWICWEHLLLAYKLVMSIYLL